MIDLRTLFQQNYSLVEFVYGLSFFGLGLAIALQSFEHSRLELARSMPWLAAFGFTHAFNEWGDLFIPLQRSYMDPSIIAFLRAVQVVLLAFSFTCLLEFGIRLLHPGQRARAWYLAPIGLFSMWVLLTFLVGLSLSPAQETWHNIGNALARYLIGFPGALLAAYGLGRHVLQRLAPLQAPHVVQMLRVAGYALALYSVFGGLIPRPVPFFPGNWINGATFTQATGVPPELIRSGIGLVLTVAIIRALDIFDIETGHFVEAMEQQQILAAERERIARDLHDGVIQKVYSAGLLVQAARRHPETLENRLDHALTILNDAIGDLRRGLGELRPAPCDQSLAESLRCIARDPRFQTLVDISLDVDLPEEPVPARTEHVLAIVNESLSNVVRHARAGHVHVRARREDGHLRLIVQDDGVGLGPSVVPGFGLQNMRDRAHLLGGELSIASEVNKGTTVALEIPWGDEK